MCLETVSRIICSVTFLGTDARLITYSSQILLLVLESGGNCFLPVLRSFSQLLWPFKGNQEWPYNGINQFIQHLLVYPTKSHGVLYVPFKHFIVQSSSTKGKYSLLPTLPLISMAWYCWKQALPVKAMTKKGSKYLSHFPILCHKILLSHSAVDPNFSHFCLGALFVAFHITYQILHRLWLS